MVLWASRPPTLFAWQMGMRQPHNRVGAGDYFLETLRPLTLRNQPHQPRQPATCRAAREIDKDKYDVTVISPRNHFLFTPLLPSTTVGTLEFR